MNRNEPKEPELRFQCKDDGIYFAEIRPTDFTLGVLIELLREGSDWVGKFLTFHASPVCMCNDAGACAACGSLRGGAMVAAAPMKTADMVSTKISLRSPDIKELIAAMRNVFATVPVGFSNEERAAIEIAAEMKWSFPKKIIWELNIPK